jgi:hypothetical protein
MNSLLCVYQQKIYTMKINEKAVYIYIYIYHHKIFQIVFGHFPVAFFIDLNRKNIVKIMDDSYLILMTVDNNNNN